jgi:hypothetical protein
VLGEQKLHARTQWVLHPASEQASDRRKGKKETQDRRECVCVGMYVCVRACMQFRWDGKKMTGLTMR